MVLLMLLGLAWLSPPDSTATTVCTSVWLCWPAMAPLFSAEAFIAVAPLFCSSMPVCSAVLDGCSKVAAQAPLLPAAACCAACSGHVAGLQPCRCR
jgi:hypothetical protein